METMAKNHPTTETILESSTTSATKTKEEAMAADADAEAADAALQAADQRHDDESSRRSQSTTNDCDGGDNSLSGDSDPGDLGEDNDDDDDEEEDGKGEKQQGAGGEDSPTSVASGVPDGDSNADLHALLAFSKKRLDAAEPAVVGEEQQAEEDATDEDAAEEEEKKEEDEGSVAGPETGASAQAADAATTQDVSSEQTETEGSDAGAKSNEDAASVGLSAKEAEAMANKPGRDSNQELWALLSYSKQRLESGTHVTTSSSETKKKSKPRRKKRSSSVGSRSAASGTKSALTSPSGSPARPTSGDDSMDELNLDNNNEVQTKNNTDAEGTDIDDDGEHSRESVASEIFRSKDSEETDSEDEEDDSDYSGESSGEEDEEDSSDEEDSDEDSRGGIATTPSFLRQLEEREEEDGRAAADAAADVRIMSDAARSYADAILSVADEKGTGNLTDEQMLEAMYVAEAAAAAGEERFTTFGSLGRLHEAKASIKDLTASMKVEMEKAAEKAKAAKHRQVARQSKLFSGERPAGKWFKGQLKTFQDTCAKVDQK